MVPIISLLLILTLSLLITRVATEALVHTGVSRDLARFQARSAFCGVGYTTAEAENMVAHPVRRRIIMILMLLGNVGIVTVMASLMGSFVKFQTGTPERVVINRGASEGGVAPAADDAGRQPDSLPLSFSLVTEPNVWVHRLLVLALGLLVLWMVALSKTVDRQLSRLIGWALRRFTHLDAYDYLGLLQFSEGYTVREIRVQESDWVRGKSLMEIRLADEGIQVLGIRRADGQYVGTPTGSTHVRAGDTLVVYGRAENLTDLDQRRADASGDRAHESRVAEQQRILAEQKAHERSRLRAEGVAQPDAPARDAPR